MSENPKISIIVPVYGVEKYIGRCLKSILNQDFKNFECLIVNDGTFDNSIKIAKEVVGNDRRFVFLEKENGGVSSARNLGIKKSSGRYLTFIDPDDYILPGYFKCIDDIISNKKPDYIAFNYYIGFGDRLEKVKKQFQILENKFVGRDDSIFLFLMRINSTHSCNKVIKSDVAKKHTYPEGIRVGEDTLYILENIIEGKEFYFSKEFFYVYMQDTSGVTKKDFNVGLFKDQISVLKKVSIKLDFYNENQRVLFFLYTQFITHLIRSKNRIFDKTIENKYCFEIIRKMSFSGINEIKHIIVIFLLKILGLIRF